jgi:TonB family protein
MPVSTDQITNTVTAGGFGIVDAYRPRTDENKVIMNLEETGSLPAGWADSLTMSSLTHIVTKCFRERAVIFIALLAISFPVKTMAGDQTTAVWIDGRASSLSDEELLRYATVSPRAGYPEAAQKAKLTGSGLYELQINKGGTTTAVAIVKSSGSAVLDQAARSAFLKWRFKPGVLRSIRVPVSWSVNRVR